MSEKPQYQKPKISEALPGDVLYRRVQPVGDKFVVVHEVRIEEQPR